jgi:hypothetical protein
MLSGGLFGGVSHFFCISKADAVTQRVFAPPRRPLVSWRSFRHVHRASFRIVVSLCPAQTAPGYSARFAAWSALLSARLAKRPSDRELLGQSAFEAESQGDFARARKTLQLVSRLGHFRSQQLLSRSRSLQVKFHSNQPSPFIKETPATTRSDLALLLACAWLNHKDAAARTILAFLRK